MTNKALVSNLRPGLLTAVKSERATVSCFPFFLNPRSKTINFRRTTIRIHGSNASSVSFREKSTQTVVDSLTRSHFYLNRPLFETRCSLLRVGIQLK